MHFSNQVTITTITAKSRQMRYLQLVQRCMSVNNKFCSEAECKGGRSPLPTCWRVLLRFAINVPVNNLEHEQMRKCHNDADANKVGSYNWVGVITDAHDTIQFTTYVTNSADLPCECGTTTGTKMKTREPAANARFYQ